MRPRLGNVRRNPNLPEQPRQITEPPRVHRRDGRLGADREPGAPADLERGIGSQREAHEPGQTRVVGVGNAWVFRGRHYGWMLLGAVVALSLAGM